MEQSVCKRKGEERGEEFSFAALIMNEWDSEKWRVKNREKGVEIGAKAHDSFLTSNKQHYASKTFASA